MAPKPNSKNKSGNSKTKERVYLTEEEKKVLQCQLDDWDSKPDKTSRDAFLASDVLPKIQQLNPEKYGPDIVSRNKEQKLLWERRAEAVHTWLKNHRPFKDRAVFKLERKLSLRQVVAKLRADDIHRAILDQQPDVKKGDKDYPGLFQQSLTVCMKGLTEDELEEFEKTRKEWQEIGPPMDVRLKAAKRYSRKGISNTHQLLHKQMFVSCVTFSFFPDPVTGVVGIICHDYIADIHLKSHGKKFKTFKEWNPKGYERIVEDLIGYADYVSNERKDGDEPEDKPCPVTLTAGDGLLPLLPPPVSGVRGTEIAKQAQEIIRAYFLRHYQMATGSDNTHTPWAQIGMNPSNYFDEACIPDGFKVQDPSRMGMSVKDLLNHLRKRQEVMGVNAFRFHHVLRNQKLEPAEYPPEAEKVLENAEDDQAARKPDNQTPPEKKPQRKPPIAAQLPIATPLPIAAPLPIAERAILNEVEVSQNSPTIPETDRTTVEKPDGHSQLPQIQLDTRHGYANGPSQSEGVHMAFAFPHDHSQPVGYHAMPVLNGPPGPSWAPRPIIHGANLNAQTATPSGPPYSTGPMINFYHPHYGVHPVPSNGHGNHVPSHQYTPAIDPRLQLPQGEPTFSIAHIAAPKASPMTITTPESCRVVVQPPTYTPGTSSPLKNSPLKKRRLEEVGQTPTRRSGRAVRTPKKLDPTF